MKNLAIMAKTIAAVGVHMDCVLSGTDEEYTEFFNSKLAKYGVDSPSQLSDEDKKKFFDEVENEWTQDEEIEEAKPATPSVLRRNVGQQESVDTDTVVMPNLKVVEADEEEKKPEPALPEFPDNIDYSVQTYAELVCKSEEELESLANRLKISMADMSKQEMAKKLSDVYAAIHSSLKRSK